MKTHSDEEPVMMAFLCRKYKHRNTVLVLGTVVGFSVFTVNNLKALD